MNRFIPIILFIQCSFSTLLAQDLLFAPTGAGQQILNPAITGSLTSQKGSLTAFYQGLWDRPGTGKSYQGAALVADMRFCLPNLEDGNYFAFGLVLQHDWNPQGGLANSWARFSGAFHIRLTETVHASVGGYAGALNYRLNPDGFRFDAQYQNGNYNPAASNGETFSGNGSTQLDLGSGLSFYDGEGRWSAGLAWHHLNKPAYTLFEDEANRLGIGWALHAAYATRKLTNGKPAAILRGVYRRQSFTGLDSEQWQSMAGIFYRGSVKGTAPSFFYVGIYVRLGGASGRSPNLNSLVPAIQLNGDRFGFSMSYDVNLVRTRSRLPGGIELSLNYNFGEMGRCNICPFL
ncbi:MAG: type IX secretion system membrane protein PorP/SprF [Lewinellaceae bacterium]|nr:type IX secretion system membrane protein PorP/SprF [Lewinellaceae bacterium]